MTQVTVQPGSHLTLHYRLAREDGSEVVATFGHSPATLQLGAGQLADTLEQLLIGLPDGAEQSFELAPGEAFGEHNPRLVERIALSALPGGGEGLELMSWIEFSDPQGGKFSGLLREMGDDYAVFDFNHPLAGQRLRFDVKIIGVL